MSIGVDIKQIMKESYFSYLVQEKKLSKEDYEKMKSSFKDQYGDEWESVFYAYLNKHDMQVDEGLWDNIHAKRERGESPAKPGDEDYPDQKSWEKAQLEEENVEGDFEMLEPVMEAEYQGRKVKLNKPMRGDVKKFKVYVKDPKTGNVKKVNFGDPDMKIRKSNPKARKSFRARHKCDQKKDKTTAGYWSCRKW